MKKALIVGIALLLLTMAVMAAPWKSKGGKVEEIPYGAETLLKMENGDGGFQLWITGDREWHCIYKPIGHNKGNGWTPSSWAPGYMYKCNVLE